MDSDYLDQPETEPAGLLFLNKRDPRRGPKVGDANERPKKVGVYILAEESEDGIIGYYIRTKEPFHHCVAHWDATVPEKHGYYPIALSMEEPHRCPLTTEPLPHFIYAVQVLEQYERHNR
jgi:hypothetical protein